MTIFNIGKLPVGSFRGAEFHLQDISTDGGRQTITHQYPGSSNRYVEDMGGFDQKFIVSVLVDNNVNYDDRDALKIALTTSGSGSLVLPTSSADELQVVAIGYNQIDNINELGISRFTINFEIASLNVLPGGSKANKGFLSGLKDSILGENKAAFDKTWKSVKDTKSKFDSANKTIKKAMREVDRATRVAQGSLDTISDLTTTINQVVATSANLVQTPAALSTKMKQVFDNLSVAYSSSQDVLDVCKSMFGFNERDQDASGSSQFKQDIKNNQDQVNNLINASALALAYNAAATIDYSNYDELSTVNSDLENGFELLPNNLNRDVYRLMLSMRIELTNIFGTLSIRLPRVITYDVLNPVSLNVLVYDLYGSLDLKNTIRDLNQFVDTSQIQGSIKILSNV